MLFVREQVVTFTRRQSVTRSLYFSEAKRIPSGDGFVMDGTDVVGIHLIPVQEREKEKKEKKE